MIIVIIAVWMGLLWMLVATGLLPRWTLWMKLSPLVIYLAGMFAIFIPLNWSSPTGPATVTVGSVQIVPQVTGTVIDVSARSWTPIAQGDALFRIDPTIYEAAVAEITAVLDLARNDLARRETLVARGTVTDVELEAGRSRVAELEARLSIAEQDLANTVVTAPFDGIVPNVVLLPGTRVSSATSAAPVMAFLAIENPVVNLVLPQNYLRHVKPGQEAEAVFGVYPGRTFSGTVAKIHRSHSDAEYDVTGSTAPIPDIADPSYVVTLELDLQGLDLPPGASGVAAVYTDEMPSTQVLRKILLRMTTWVNFL